MPSPLPVMSSLGPHVLQGTPNANAGFGTAAASIDIAVTMVIIARAIVDVVPPIFTRTRSLMYYLGISG